jgi:hypothetical protein
MQSTLCRCRAFSVIVKADGDRNYIVNDIGLKIGGTKPSIKRVTEFLSPAVKLPGRKGDHSSPSSAEVKNVWDYTSSPYSYFVAPCCVNDYK